MTYDKKKKLKKLEELKTNGTLTEEEFQREKERILNEETRQTKQTTASNKTALIRAAGKCLSDADASFAICRLDITGPGFRAPHCHVAHQ